MSLEYRWRDVRRPPRSLLESAGVRDGMTVLDFGCGPGSFSIAAAELVGRKGSVLAVDIHPLALRSVQRRAQRLELGQLRALSAHDLSSVPNASVDVALLFDVLHELGDAPWALPGIRRVLRRNGALLVTDHHMSLSEIAEQVVRSGGFRLVCRGEALVRFELDASGLAPE